MYSSPISDRALAPPSLAQAKVDNWLMLPARELCKTGFKKLSLEVF